MPISPVVTPSPNVGTHGYITIVDQQGYVIGTVATSDGAQFGSISGESMFLYNAGGPPLSDGTPSQLAFDRVRSIQGKKTQTSAITTTVAGDANLVFSAAPKTLMPGIAIQLTGAANSEMVYVSDAFVISATTTTIPLKNPVVNAGQTSASWDIFMDSGPQSGAINPNGVMPVQGILVDTVTGNYHLARECTNDTSTFGAASTVGLLWDGAVNVRPRVPSTFKSFNAQAVTVSSANTPTAIWTPASGKKFRLMGYWFSTTVAAGLLFHDLATVGGGGAMPCPSPIHAAAGVIQSPHNMGNGILSAAANNKLWIDATAATTLTGFVFGTEE